MKSKKIYTVVGVVLMLCLAICQGCIDEDCLGLKNKKLAIEKKRLQNEATERARTAVKDYLSNIMTLTFGVTVEEPQLAENPEEMVYADKIALQYRFIANSNAEQALLGNKHRVFQVAVKVQIPLISKCEFTKGIITEVNAIPQN
jgi:hypothetical protein